MSTQSFVPPELLPHLAKLKPYILVILKKGANYAGADTPKIIQSEHLPYVFENIRLGNIAISMPVRDTTEIAAIAIFTVTGKEAAAKIMDNDPAVKQGLFTYELLNAVGMQGDTLP
jgi:hypothetical protein